MKKKIIIIAVIIAAFASSIALHIWEIKKINEFSNTFETLSQTQKSPDTPGSPEGNTEGPGTASSEPLLPS